ncbi:MAG: PAS domain S-box protein, partial [Methanoregula sp.]|nr:PAS domain S-box protein [Methanoregula sp.]
MADGIRVLCVDDELPFLELGKLYLEQSGEFFVDIVTSASEALDILDKKTYDAIVSDYLMPGINGIDFLKRVRASDTLIPFIMVTGRSREELVIEALNNGVDFYLPKGGDPKALYKELMQVIRQYVLTKRPLMTLSEQEQRYHDLQNANDLIQSVAPDGHFLFVNKKWRDTLGYEEKDLPALTIFDVIHEESIRHCMETFQRVISGENVGFIDAVFKTRTGNKVYVEGMADCRMADGQPQYTRGLFKDVTDRKKADAALKESEEAFRAMVEQSGDGIIITDFLGMLQFANRRAWDIIEHPSDRRITENFNVLDILSPKSRIKAVYDLLQVSRGIDSFEVNYNVITLEKKEKWIECLGKKISHKGSPAMLLSFRDVTERTKMGTVLKESEEKFRTIYENSPYPICINSIPDGKFISVNPVFLRSSGYTEPEILGKSPIDIGLLSLLDYGRLTSHMLLSGKLEHVPMVLMGKGGIPVHVQFSTLPVTINGRPAIMSMAAEITKLKRVEEQLVAEVSARTKAEQEITSSLKEKDLLLREIHHRVKNNLQIITSLLNLQSRYLSEPKVLEAIKDTQSRVRAMALVHERIYRSHRIAEINLKEYLNYLARQIFNFYNIPQHQIVIAVTMDDLMAGIDTVIPVGLIMNELISNSAKHAFPGGRKGSVTIECTAQGPDTLRFVYHDNGIGMPAGFDWKNSETLGLRLVNDLVDQLNGTIETGAGEGTTLILTVQQKRDPAPS